MPSQEGVPVFICVMTSRLCHCERSEAIQNLSAERLWIASALAMTAYKAIARSALVPRTQRSVPSTVRCRAGAHAVDCATLIHFRKPSPSRAVSTAHLSFGGSASTLLKSARACFGSDIIM